MSNCPECGEKVAENDVFCSYCGITLTSAGKTNDDMSMSETIVGSSVNLTEGTDYNKTIPPEIPVPASTEDIRDEKTEVAADSTAEAPLPPPASEDSEPENVGYTPGKTSASWSMKTGSVEIPAEILAGAVGDSANVEEPLNIPPVAEEKFRGEPFNEERLSVPPISFEEPIVFQPEEPAVAQKSIEIAPAEIIEPLGDSRPVDEIPTPLVIKNIEFESDITDIKPPDEKISEPEPVFFGSEPEIEETPQIESDIPFVFEETPRIEPDIPFAFEETPQIESDAQPTDAGPEISPPDLTSDFVQTIPYTDENIEIQRQGISQQLREAGILQPKEETIEPVEEIKPVGEVAEFFPDLPDTAAESVSEDVFTPALDESISEPADVPLPDLFQIPEPAEIKPDIDASADSPPEWFTPPPVDILPEPEAVMTPVEAVPFISEVAAGELPPADHRPFTKPNIGNGDTDGRRGAKLKPLDEGTLLNNRYEIVRKIGGGGMGAVYLAKDNNLGGILRAVKEMVQSYIEAEQQDKAVSDFQREAMILTNLEHGAIPTIYDYFFDEKEGRFYLVMKYISGGDLAGRLRASPEGRLDEKTVTEWAIQIADVLDYLHRQDPVIVYRDLKPANIMIDGNTGRLMLIDFGIARSINKEEKGVTAVGTMGYAPPELFSGNVEARSDIYSLGSTMFHLLTGADPQSNPLLIFDFQKNPRPRQINPQLSDQIEQILMRAVEYNAELRFASARELRVALEDHLVNLQTGKVSFGIKAAPSAVGFSEQPVFCGFCGKQIVASDVFCAFCGSQQPISQQSFQPVPSFMPQVATAKLYVVLTNELETSGFSLEKTENLIGRRDPMSNIFPEVDLSKFDPQTKISRRHARIWRDGSTFMLEDLGSSNGTILYAGTTESVRLLPRQPRLLAHGDKFRVGDTTLQFTVA